MRNRAITAIFFVIIMIGGVYISPYTFVLLFGVIAAICLWEFYRIATLTNASRLTLSMLLGMSPYLLVALFQLTEVDASASTLITISLLFLPVLFLFFLYELFSAAKNSFHNIASLTLGIIYVGIPFTLLEWIALDDGYQPNIVLGLLLLNWANDTGAYLVGSRFGKRLLLPRISPKKTWEGTLAGVTLTLLSGVGLGFIFPELPATDWVVLAAIVGIFGSLGDLIESMFKRNVQIKDSGKLLPGHGGLLDRFDAFLFMLPFATAYLLLIK